MTYKNSITYMQGESWDPLFMSIDANFRLCRREKAASTSKEDIPIYQTPFFLPQHEVDKYVQSQQGLISYNLQVKYFASTTTGDKCCIFIQGKCSDFKAGDALRSRSRYKALDETAVLGAICRHDFPLRMLSLKHGERYACTI